MDDTREAFGSLLKRFRLRARLTQEALAEAAGISLNAVSALERGERKRPYPHTVGRLATALNLDAEDSALLAHASRLDPEVDANLAPVAVDASLLPLLIGRDDDLAFTASLLSGGSTRLLTLTGPGGVGKTRLALALHERLRDSFPDGSFVALLAGADAVGRAPAMIGDAIGIAAGEQEQGWARIAAALRDRRALLLLDNLEQLPGIEEPIRRLLELTPTLTLLATSRRPLGIRGEQEYAVRPLSTDAQSGGEGPAIKLFLDRARAVDPRFSPDDDEMRAIGHLCARLDGLPLAIELAAARIRLLSPVAMQNRLAGGLDVLASGPKDLPARQQTMRSAIAWSYDLLNAEERRVFRAVSIFTGGCEIGDGETVVGDGDGVALDTLASLAAQHLVMQEQESDLPEPRINMLETIRAFGLEKLREHGEDEHLRLRHAECYRVIAERVGPRLMGPEQAVAVRRLSRDAENLRAALETFTRLGADEQLVRMMWALWRYWWLHAEFPAIGRRSLELRAGGIDHLAPLLRAQVLIIHASDVWSNGAEPRFGLDAALEGFKLAREHGDDRTAGIGALTAGLLAMGAMEFHQQATEMLEASRERFVAADQRWGDGMALGFQSLLSLGRGNPGLARRQVRESVAISLASGDQVSVHQSRYTQGLIELADGNAAEAQEMFEAGLRLARSVGDLTNVGFFLRGLAGAATLLGEPERALTLAISGRDLLTTGNAPASRHYRLDGAILDRLEDDARAMLRETDRGAVTDEARRASLHDILGYALSGQAD